MITLSYGFQKPQSGDKGTPFFTAMEANIQKLNDHTHDGSNSAPISAKSVASIQQALSAGDWVTYGGPPGFYRQLVTMPTGFVYDNVQFGFRIADKPALLGAEKVSATTFYVYTNDNSIAPKVIYGG